MRSVNLHLIAFLLVLLTVVGFNWQYGSETLIFFGFAENKELEIRLDNPGVIKNIYVTSGSKVSKGDVLIEVAQTALEMDQSDLSHEIAELNSQLIFWEAATRSSISQLKSQKIAKENAILSQIDQLESDLSIKKSLLIDLESIQPATDQSGKSPNVIKIEGLKKQLELIIQPIDSEIKKLQNELNSSSHPLKSQINKLKNQISFSNSASEKLKLTAPRDGIVGSIFCKEGEQVSSFNTLLTFYEENPNQVKAYVLENLLLKVKLGDSILVNSVVQSASNCKGVIIGMGSRIVEIPERLTTNPAIKFHGREIIIEIPTENEFLQKEKVILKLNSTENNQNDKVIKVFTPPKITSSIQD